MSNGTSAIAAKTHCSQEDVQHRNRRITLDHVAHSLARSVQAAATVVQRKKGDYALPSFHLYMARLLFASFLPILQLFACHLQ